MKAEEYVKKKSIIRDYDVKANSYDRLYLDEQMLKYSHAEKRITTVIDSKVLDLGCGTGLFAEKIMNKVELFVGIDISTGMLLKAKSKFSKKSNVHLINSDIDHLPLKDDVFDHAFIFTIFRNPSEILRIIKELEHVMNFNSTIIMSILKKNICQNDLEKVISNINIMQNFSIEDTDTKDIFIKFKFKQSKRFNFGDELN